MSHPGKSDAQHPCKYYVTEVSAGCVTCCTAASNTLTHTVSEEGEQAARMMHPLKRQCPPILLKLCHRGVTAQAARLDQLL